MCVCVSFSWFLCMQCRFSTQSYKISHHAYTLFFRLGQFGGRVFVCFAHCAHDYYFISVHFVLFLIWFRFVLIFFLVSISFGWNIQTTAAAAAQARKVFNSNNESARTFSPKTYTPTHISNHHKNKWNQKFAVNKNRSRNSLSYTQTEMFDVE